MADVLHSLWPSVETQVLSPIAILKFQASQLREQTKGLLEAEVKTWKSKDGDTVYDFNIIAPPLDRYTYLLFQTWHPPDFPYPVTLRFEPWIKEAQVKNTKASKSLAALAFEEREPASGLRTPSSPSELLGALGSLLQSPYTKGVLSSLISRINDAELTVKTQESAIPKPSADTPPGADSACGPNSPKPE